MSGGFSAGGLITGLDSNSLIAQLMQIERQPIIRLQEQIDAFETQKTAIQELRTQLLSLRNAAQDFRFNNVFSQFGSASSEESVLGVEIAGPSPVIGSYAIDVQQLASATVASSSAVLGSPIDPNANLDSNGMTTELTAGTFSVNGIEFTVDPTSQSLNTVLGLINASGAGVTATYDAVADTVSFENSAAGDTNVINFGVTDDTSNFLSAISIEQATQYTGGSGSTVATSTRNLGAVDPNAVLNTSNFASGAVSAGTFQVNGITITVDPTASSLNDVLTAITDSDAGVSATYDSSSDTIRVVADTLGSRTVNFSDGGSGFLAAVNLTAAVQDAGEDAQFTINGGAVQTRNTNEVSDAVGDVAFNLLSVGTSTVTVTGDDDLIVEDINEFLTAFNESVDLIRTMTGQEGDIGNDTSISQVEMYLRSEVFSMVSGITGSFSSLVQIGVSTGDTFDSTGSAHLELDEDVFREALRDDRSNVSALFHNAGETGIADKLFEYVDEITRTTGFLNNRGKANGSLDRQISSLEDQIERVERRVALREERLRRQFTQLEVLASSYQADSAALSGMAFF